MANPNNFTDYAESGANKKTVLLVSEMQKQVLKEFFNLCQWNFEDALCSTSVTVASNTAESDMSDGKDDEDGESDSEYIDPHDPDADECRYCYCRPCITDESNQQLWWERQPRIPSQQNRKFRKPCYQRFWAMLMHKQAWQDPRYKAKKAAALGVDPRMRRFKWVHRRDIMPDCVLTTVRTWFPNVRGVDYMNHKWG